MPSLGDAELRVGEHLPLGADDTHRLQRVLRKRAGDVLTVGDGAGRVATATIGHGAKSVAITAVSTTESAGPRHTLLAPLIKGDRWLWLLEKTTELGVAAILPLVTDHSVVRPADTRAARQRARWLERVRAACEQAGRPTLPVLAEPATLDKHLASLPTQTAVFYGDARAADAVVRQGAAVVAAPLHVALADAADDAPIACCVGPEGGFSERERVVLGGFGARPVWLGDYVLRAETAAIAAAAQLALHRSATP